MPASNWLPSGKAARRIAGAIFGILTGALIVVAIAIFLTSFLPFCPLGEIPKQQAIYASGAQVCPAAAIFLYCRGLQISADIRGYIFENLIPISAALGAGATVAIAWFTATLKTSTDRLWETGEKQSRISRLQFLAARQANRIARESLHAADRPWVGIDKVDLQPFVAGQQIDVTVTIKNTGRTPAMRLRAMCAPRIVPRGQPFPAMPEKVADGAPRVVLFPNGDYHLKAFPTEDAKTGQLLPTPTASDLVEINSGRYRVCIACIIEYEDARGGEHHTTTRLVYDHRVGGFGTDTEGSEAT